MGVGKVEATLVAENTFSDAIAIRGGFNLSISGISGDTVTLQRSFDAGANWKDVKSYTADKEDYGNESELGIQYRVGIKTGNYSAGTVVVRISL